MRALLWFIGIPNKITLEMIKFVMKVCHNASRTLVLVQSLTRIANAIFYLSASAKYPVLHVTCTVYRTHGYSLGGRPSAADPRGLRPDPRGSAGLPPKKNFSELRRTSGECAHVMVPFFLRARSARRLRRGKRGPRVWK